MKAPKEMMWAIWAMLVKHFHRMLTNDAAQLKPSMYAVIIKFLKDNGITATSIRTDKLTIEMEKLLEDLPEFDDGEVKQ